MEKKFGKIKKYVTVSAIILGALATLAACSSGSKESKKN